MATVFGTFAMTESALEVAAHRRVANRFLAHVAGLQETGA